MLISKKYHFVFIHVYKNAGTSVMNALLPFAASKMQYATCRVLNKFGIIPSFDPAPFPAHISAAALIEEIGKEAYDSLFSFAIVRNPWDWQVSLYTYMLKTKRHHQYNLAQTFGGFDGYIRWRCSEEVRLQKDFICSKNGDLLVNK